MYFHAGTISGRYKLALVFAFAASIAAFAAPSAVQPADDKTAQVDKLFAGWDTTATPGLALAVIRDGAVIYKRGYGMAKLEDGLVMTPAKIFDVGSVSKQFTAACVALLVREGRIWLDDDIRKYFPEIPAYERPITIRHLIHHTSGIRDYNSLLAFAGFRAESDCPTVEESREIIFRQKKLNDLPGKEFSYTNSGYFLLGQLVERISGKSLNAFAQERIFRPLGMRHTFFQEDHTRIIADRATGYDPAGDTFKIDMSNWDETGDGNVYTSVEDLTLWDQAFYSNALGRDVMDMVQTHGVLNDGTEIDYAWGLRVRSYRGLKLVEHGGAWAGFRAQIIRFPEQRFSVIALANRSDFDGSACFKIAEIYLGDLMGAIEPPAKPRPTLPPPTPSKNAPAILTEARLREYAGEYISDELLGARYRVTVEKGRLAIHSRTIPEAFIVAAGDDHMNIAKRDGGRLAIDFIRNKRGAVIGFELSAGRMRGVAFVKTKKE
jgi:CubicO group peptidase (beta-lactamase class C family)